MSVRRPKSAPSSRRPRLAGSSPAAVAKAEAAPVEPSADSQGDPEFQAGAALIGLACRVDRMQQALKAQLGPADAKPGPGKPGIAKLGPGKPASASEAARQLAQGLTTLCDLLGHHFTPPESAAPSESLLSLSRKGSGRLFPSPVTIPDNSFFRIVGGFETKNFPSCCCLGTGGGRWFASGVLIAKNAVLTAAHCNDPRPEQVFLNARRLDGTADDDEPPVVKRVLQRIPHRDYKPYEKESGNDIMILIIDPIKVSEMNKAMGPTPWVNRCSQKQFKNAKDITVVGFGHNDILETGGLGVKRQVDVAINRDALPGVSGYDPIREFVAGKKQLGQDSCKGDSGGPAFIYDRKEGYLLAGITSRATRDRITPCGDGGIYTNVTAYSAWIERVLYQWPC